MNETMIEADGKLRIIRSQDVEGVLRSNAYLAETHKTGGDFRHAGAVPLVIVEQWSRECGAAIGTKEFAEYVKRKLNDGEFSKFRIKGF